MTDADRPSGLAVPIRLPPAIARLRRRWDRAARAGPRPHVTVLYPFLPTPPARRPTSGGAWPRSPVAVEPFEVRFHRVRRFDDGVVWIEPEPAEPFRRLTAPSPRAGRPTRRTAAGSTR